MRHASQHNICETRIVSLFLLLYITILSLACYIKYSSFQYADFDLAVHTQSIHNLLRGSVDCSILGIPFPGNHMALSLLLIAPFYLIFPSPVTILLFQTIVLASGAIAVLIYAKKYLPHPYPALISSLYLLYPPLIYMNLYEFHPVALASTFLLCALLAYDRRNALWYAVFLLLAMSCQENIALIVIMLGVKAVFDRRSFRWSLYPAAAGAAWFAACIFWIMPMFNPGIIRFDAIYGHFGDSLPAIIKEILRHPVSTIQYMITLPKILYAASLLLPLAFTSLLAPLQLLPALPIIAQRLLSSRGSEITILSHYQAELIPFIFVAAIHGLHRLGQIKKGRWQYAAAVCMGALTILSLDMSRAVSALRNTFSYARLEERRNVIRDGIIRQIPDGASVTATFRYLPQLAARDNLHSLHHIYTGFYTLSNTPYPIPEDQDFILLDTDDPLTFGVNNFYTPSGFSNLQALAATQPFRIDTQHDASLLLSSCRTTDSSKAGQFILSKPGVPAAEATEYPAIRSLSWQSSDAAYIDLRITWQAMRAPSKDFNVWLQVTSGSKLLKSVLLAPGERFNPPPSWPANMDVTTCHRLSMPVPATQGDLLFSVTVVPI